MQITPIIPADYSQVMNVSSLEALESASLTMRHNVIRIKQDLIGDYDALTAHVVRKYNMGPNACISFNETEPASFKLSEFFNALGEGIGIGAEILRAANQLESSLSTLHEISGQSPSLMLITGRGDDLTRGNLCDHIDGGKIRYGMNFSGQATEIVHIDDVLDTSGRIVKVKKDARHYRFGLGDIWKIAGLDLEDVTNPTVHNAPRSKITFGSKPSSMRLLALT